MLVSTFVSSRLSRTALLMAAVLLGVTAAVGLAVLLGGEADAAPTCNKTWTGDSDDEYTNPANWDPVGVPAGGQFACAESWADIYFDSDSIRNVRGIHFEGGLEIASGELRIGTTSGAEDSYVGELTMSDGRRGGTAELTVGETVYMYDGTLGSPNADTNARGGRTVIDENATLYVEFGLRLSGQHILRVEGEAYWSDGDISLCDAAVIENAGYFELPNDGYSVLACGAGRGRYINEASGQAVKLSGSLGDTTVDVSFENDGLVVVEADTLSVAEAPAGSDGDWGTWEVAPGATLEFTGSRTLQPPTSFEGEGLVRTKGGTQTFVNVGMYRLDHEGTIAGTPSVLDSFDWDGGVFTGSGTLSVWSGATVTGSGTVNNGYTVRNQTAWTVGGSSISLCGGGRVLNEGTLTLNIATPFIGCGVLGIGAVENAPDGVVRKGTGPDTSITAAFKNDGTLDVPTGRTLTLSGNLTDLTGTTPAGGIFDVDGLLKLTTSGGVPVPMNLVSGRLQGVGTVASAVNNTGGVVAPGASPGILSITGAYQQGPGATLEIEIDGTTPGTAYDRLAVSGTATLAGTLQLDTGFDTLDSHQFTILTAAGRTGEFSTINGQPGPGRVYRAIYDGGDVIVTPAPPPAGVVFTPLDPVRILDSRPGSQVGPYNSPWSTQTIRPVTVRGGTTGVPVDAEAVVLNVTATGTTASSHLRIWPTGESLPIVSNVNWQAGWTIPNSVTVKVGPDDAINVYNNNGNAHVVIDIVGYYRPDLGAGLTSLDPVRILDSRPGSQVGPYNSPWSTRTIRPVTVRGGTTGVPVDAEAVVLNVTVTGTTASSNLRIWPTGLALPLVSSLNWRAGWTIPNAVTVKVGAGGQVNVYNNNGNANVIIDVVGYFAAGTGDEFHPLTPVRIQDSRATSPVGLYNSPWITQLTRPVPVVDVGGVPLEAKTVLLNTTVTGTTASSNLRIWPSGPTVPVVSSLNWQPGWTIANAVTTKVGPGTVNVYNNNGAAHVIGDVAGWYG